MTWRGHAAAHCQNSDAAEHMRVWIHQPHVPHVFRCISACVLRGAISANELRVTRRPLRVVRGPAQLPACAPRRVEQGHRELGAAAFNSKRNYSKTECTRFFGAFPTHERRAFRRVSARAGVGENSKRVNGGATGGGGFAHNELRRMLRLTRTPLRTAANRHAIHYVSSAAGCCS
jgi:hypothetical protein